MKQTRARQGLVVLIVLLFALSLVAPAAAGPHDDESSGTTSDSGLSESSSNSTAESGDDSSSDSSGLLSDSDSDWGTDGSGSDGTSSDFSLGSDDSDSAFGSDDSSGSDDSDSAFGSDDSSGSDDSDSAFGSDDSSGSDDSDSAFGSDDSSGSDDSDSAFESDDSSGSDSSQSSTRESSDSASSTDSSSEDAEPLEQLIDSDGAATPALPSRTLADTVAQADLDGTTVGETDLFDVDSVSGTVGSTEYSIELLELSSGDGLVEVRTGDGSAAETTGALATLGASVVDLHESLTTGSSLGTDPTADAARTASVDSSDGPSGQSDETPPVDGGSAAIEPREADAGGGDGAAPPRNAIGFPVSPDDVPGGPAGAGAMVGLAGAAAAVAARQSGAFAGMSGSLATTAKTAAVATPGTGHLDRLVRMLAPFRYSRYDDSDPLEHEARDAMFEVVEESPGTYLSEIADQAEIPLSTARHHIRVLEREDLVSGAKVRGKRRFYPAHTEGVELAAAMNDESTAAVIDALARLGASSVSDLADELGKDPSTVTHHVQRLEEDEVVVRERDGRAVMNKLSAAARTALQPEEARATGPSAGEAMASD
jgi:DNA-binding MarR family transcriptional regulator